MDSKHRLSRRDMLKMSAAGAAGAATTVLPVGMAGASAPSQDEVVLNIDFRGYGADPTGENEVQGTALGMLLDNYHAMHPNVTVNHAPIDPGAWDDIQQWAARRLQAADGPDLLFGNWTYLIEEWMTADLVGWWDPYLESPNPYVEGNMQWADQFIKPGERQSNGQTAWLGLDNTTLWTYYNKDMFAANGWEAPTSWADQISLYQAIQDSGVAIPVSDYFGLAYAVWTFDMATNQVLHSTFEEIAAGDLREPLPAQVSEAVLDGRYGIDQGPYQDCFRLLTEWWQYTPEGAHSGGGDGQDYGLFLAGEAASRYGGIWENKSLLRDMPTNENPFEWGAFPIPIISTMESEYATGKQTAAVFIAGHTLFTLPAYNSGAKRDATADLLMYLSVPDHIGALLAEDQGLVPNIKNVSLPPSLAGFRIDEDATYWFVNSWGNTHITPEARDAWVRNWQLVLLGGMSVDEYTEVMQAELVKAAEDTLNV